MQPVLKGSVLAGTESISHEAFHTLVLSDGENEAGVSLTAAEDSTEFILVCVSKSSLFQSISPAL